ncbi:MAG TPA: winged helix DNA-binding domain-containing protein [Nocardioides sp.]|jgi:hypothetical protein
MTARAGLTWRQAMAWRVRRQHLDDRAPRAATLDVVTVLGGLHAQLFSSAELSLWNRVDGLAAGDVDRAAWQQRALVKTWAMRGTLHLLPTSEYPLVQAALNTYEHYLKPVWLRNFGVSRDELELLIATVGQALDGPPLTRTELADEVARRTGSAKLGDKLRQSWGVFLKPASFRGQLCFASSSGQNVRFTRPDRWLPPLPGSAPPAGTSPGPVPEPVAVVREAAVAEVTRRYLAAYGPATRADFARWWGVTPARAGALLAGLGDEATQVEVEGVRAWLLAAHVAELAGAAPSRSVRLLPAFDPYVIAASRDVPALLAGDVRDRVYRQQGWISPVLLVNGRMDGVWSHERKGARLAVRIEPFVALPAWARRAAEAEAERLAGFLGGALELTWAACPPFQPRR